MLAPACQLPYEHRNLSYRARPSIHIAQYLFSASSMREIGQFWWAQDNRFLGPLSICNNQQAEFTTCPVLGGCEAKTSAQVCANAHFLFILLTPSLILLAIVAAYIHQLLYMFIKPSLKSDSAVIDALCPVIC